MTTISDIEETGVTPELDARGHKVIADAKEYTWGWGKLAQFLADNPDIADQADAYSNSVMVYLPPADGVVATLADYTRRAMKAGARVEKTYDDNYGTILLHFGPVCLQVYAHRDVVCERISTGVQTVVSEIPDPSIVVPTITVTEEVETFEWRCVPLLAGERSGGAA